MTTRRERLEGGLYGLLVGDALGVPYEFHSPEGIPGREQIELEPPAGYSRTYPTVPAGTWSDDGAHTLCLLDSLLERGRLDLQDLGNRLVRWYEQGHMAVGGHVFDVGVQTRVALMRMRAGTSAMEAGPAGENDNGNGALMRVLSLALWHRGSDADLAREAMVQSRVTHGHMRSQVCCALYCLWARRVMEGASPGWAEAVASFRELYPEGTRQRTELEASVRPDTAEKGRGGGHVVDSLLSARDCVALGPYEQVVKAAVALGHDTDTTAAVAGGIAGLRDGVSGIPSRWLEALRGREIVQPLLEKLIARHEG
jgi:ADP-ribosyl-[dinitrogen reductase] hydrolase